MKVRFTKKIGLIFTLALIAPQLHAQDADQAKAALSRLKAGNARFANDKLAPRDLDSERRKELLKGEKPFAIILTDADSRVAPEHIFQQGLGEIYVLRIAGNVAGPGIVGSIEFALQTLPTCSLIVVMGNDDSAAVKAALNPEPVEGNVGLLIKQIDPGKDLPKDPKEALALAVKNNAIRQAQLLSEKSAAIKEAGQLGRVQIVPAVYALSTGKVEWLEMPKLTGKHPVVIKVTVPTAEALVWLDDVPTKSRGTKRIFEVAPVDAEQEFTYRIKVEWTEDGATRKRERTVHFKGGMMLNIDLRADTDAK
jgi:carbonic anhydrase